MAEISKALIIAAVMGFTVDMALKKNLARDAMKTAFGYTLPAELRDGMKWLCISSRLEIKLADVGLEDRLEVTRTYRRTLRNITNKIERIKPYTHIGEYFFDNYASEIVLLRYKIGNDGWVPVLADQDAFGNRPNDVSSKKTYKARQKLNHLSRLSRRSKKYVRIRPNSTIAIEAICKFYQRKTDS